MLAALPPVSRTVPVVIVLGGLAMIVGSLLTWIMGTTFLGFGDVLGVETTEGRIMLVLGIATSLAPLAWLAGRRHIAIGLVPLFSLLALLAVAYAAATIPLRWVEDAAWNAAFPGWGMYIVAIGGICSGAACGFYWARYLVRR